MTSYPLRTVAGSAAVLLAAATLAACSGVSDNSPTTESEVAGGEVTDNKGIDVTSTDTQAGGGETGTSEVNDVCIIETPGYPVYEGPCRYGRVISQDTGLEMFSMSPPDGVVWAGNVTSISVNVMPDGHAEVRGLTGYGVNSRWGEATRSPDDGACWVSSDFRVCGY